MEMAKVDKGRPVKRLLPKSRKDLMAKTGGKLLKMERHIKGYFRGYNI